MFRKLGIAFPLVFRAAQTGNNPLADIPAQMQDEITRAVGRRIGPPPNVVLGKLLKTFHDVRQILFREQLLGAGKKQARGFGYFWFHGRHLAFKS